jgi:hypothetical protein
MGVENRCEIGRQCARIAQLLSIRKHRLSPSARHLLFVEYVPFYQSDFVVRRRYVCKIVYQ